MLRRFATCVALLCLLSIANAAAQSQRPVTAIISALALQPMPESSTIEIVTYDDGALPLSIGAVARNALAAQGYQVAAGGQLLLGIELRDRLTLNQPQGSGLGSDRVDIGEIAAANERVNIFADSDDSVLGGRIGPGTADALVFGLYVTLNDRSTGRRVWQAEIMADISSSSRESAGPLMAQAIATRLGKAIAQEEIVLE